MLTLVLLLFFLLLFLGVPVSFVILGAASLGILFQGNSPTILVQQLVQGASSISLMCVPFFIISGDIACKGSVSQKIVNVANAFLGHIYGGLGIATIVACAFFGAITGSAIATVVAIGALMYPQLVAKGYPRGTALGLITCAGTLGVLIPPSIPMVQICIVMETSIGRQFAAGFLPGILLTAAFSAWTWLVCRRSRIPREERCSWRNRLMVIKKSFWSLMYPVVVLGSIYGGIATPTESAVLSVVYVILVELLVYRTMTLRELLKTIESASVSAACITLTIAAAQVFTWYLTTAQVSVHIYNAITTFFTSPLALYAVLCLLLLGVGCFTSVIATVVILGPILMPILVHFGIDRIQFGIVMTMMASLGFVTPPFGHCLFATMKVSGGDMVEVTKGALPYILIMVAGAALFVLFPQISTALPNLLMGPP